VLLCEQRFEISIARRLRAVCLGIAEGLSKQRVQRAQERGVGIPRSVDRDDDPQRTRPAVANVRTLCSIRKAEHVAIRCDQLEPAFADEVRAIELRDDAHRFHAYRRPGEAGAHLGRVASQERGHELDAGAVLPRVVTFPMEPLLAGTRVEFEPQARAKRMPMQEPSRERVAGRDLEGTVIVLVDDEELILDATRTLLEQWKCTVIAAPSGVAALEQLSSARRPPDVLICDYRLREGETGVSVVAAVRHEFNADIPAILITGDTDPDQIRAIAATGLAVLHKPLREDELSDAICAMRTVVS
jgi:CheY-like chemotaxis protein